jgi:hypothetical protein
MLIVEYDPSIRPIAMRARLFDLRQRLGWTCAACLLYVLHAVDQTSDQIALEIAVQTQSVGGLRQRDKYILHDIFDLLAIIQQCVGNLEQVVLILAVGAHQTVFAVVSEFPN